MDRLKSIRAGFGFARAELDELCGGDAQANADEAHAVFAGANGPVRDAVVLNAAGRSSHTPPYPAAPNGCRRGRTDCAAPARRSTAGRPTAARAMVRFGQQVLTSHCGRPPPVRLANRAERAVVAHAAHAPADPSGEAQPAPSASLGW